MQKTLSGEIVVTLIGGEKEETRSKPAAAGRAY